MEPQPEYMTSEKQIQAVLIEALLRSGALVQRINSGRSGYISYNTWATLDEGRHTAGASDLIALLPDGETWWVECKAPGGKLSADQERFKAAILYRGGIHYTSNEALEALENGN